MWTLVVPVKVLSRAKSRLAADTGPHREQLALAVAADTVSAALRCKSVASVLVVVSDPVAGAELAALGAQLVPDEPDGGLNPALVHGAAQGRLLKPEVGVAALFADLPALRPDELERALDAAAEVPCAFLADAAGSGTTLYATRPGVPFSPRFGPDSRSLHRAAGARELMLDDIPSVRQDVDTLDDLRAALALGVGPRTAAVARSILGDQRVQECTG